VEVVSRKCEDVDMCINRILRTCARSVRSGRCTAYSDIEALQHGDVVVHKGNFAVPGVVVVSPTDGLSCEGPDELVLSNA
jgi:hypothetical protein